MNCPECRKPLNEVKVDRVDLGACAVCGGLWFPRAELSKVASEELTTTILEASRGKLGRRKQCQQQLKSDGPCPKCQRPAPVCPDCGRAPLVIGNVKGVNLDVCPGCAGIWFDPGELQLVAGHNPAVQRVQMGAFKAGKSKEPGKNSRVTCSSCQKVITRVNAFQKDDLVYCGTCCPKGAAPVVALKTERHEHHDSHGRFHEHHVHDFDLGEVAFRLFQWMLK